MKFTITKIESGKVYAREKKVMECFQCRFPITAEDNGICINEDTPHEMYQCNDCHFNEFGYYIMSECLVFKNGVYSLKEYPLSEESEKILSH